jgi:hypothetical protein
MLIHVFWFRRGCRKTGEERGKVSQKGGERQNSMRRARKSASLKYIEVQGFKKAKKILIRKRKRFQNEVLARC